MAGIALGSVAYLVCRFFFSQIFCLINLGWRLCLRVRRIKRLFNSHDVVVDIGNLVACKALFACGEKMENSVHMSD